MIASKRHVLKRAATLLRLGADPEAVALDIVRVCRQELAELNVPEMED